MGQKLIETALPLLAINKGASREKSIRHGHPSTLGRWWGRRPLTLARAIIFASLVDDPSSHPELFPTVDDQMSERGRLLELMEKLIFWENFHDPIFLAKAQTEIRRSIGEAWPSFLDPFAGSGSLPLEAQKLGLEVQASDLNPVAVTLNKALMEISPRFAGREPVNPQSGLKSAPGVVWARAHGLAADVAYYSGELQRVVAERLGSNCYSPIKPRDSDSSELDIPVDAWIWVRAVKCPNPACGHQAPLATNFILSRARGARGRDIYVEPTLSSGPGGRLALDFTIKNGRPPLAGTVRRGRAKCFFCQSPISFSYIQAEGQKGRLKSSLMAMVTRGDRRKVYCPPDSQPSDATVGQVDLDFDFPLPNNTRIYRPRLYGLSNYSDLFTARQLGMLSQFLLSVKSIEDSIESDARQAGFADDGLGLEEGGSGAKAYSQAVVTYLSLMVSKMSEYHGCLCSWNESRTVMDSAFSRLTLPMVWSFAEANPFSGSTGGFPNMAELMVKVISELSAENPAVVQLADARTLKLPKKFMISTDLTFYDDVNYSDLSDYFYLWLRPLLKDIYKSVFSTVLTPKDDELVFNPHRFGGDKEAAQAFFENGARQVFDKFYQYGSDDFPLTIFGSYSPKDIYKEGVEDDQPLKALTGFETMVSTLIEAGHVITGVWPFRIERVPGSVSQGSQAPSICVVLVARKRLPQAPVSSQADFLRLLKGELKLALAILVAAKIPKEDLAQVAMGPGLAVYSRFSSVLAPNGSAVKVREALRSIKAVVDNYWADRAGED
ncbi:MAG: DUF1156 domain-containing protein [Deltaproteobacteria bacterium]|jgi:putative DNA methylase|nr:DUF1156 domain-containing protein [Deltaproteobacteria bacterium]